MSSLNGKNIRDIQKIDLGTKNTDLRTTAKSHFTRS